MLPNKGALFGERYRIIVSTDIGGSDPDDFQSMVHYLLYSDIFDTEGLISSAWGNGRAKDILDVIDVYEKDYHTLLKHSNKYPTPDYLRTITKQGEIDFAPYKGFKCPTEGSNWIIECAKRNDDRPLYILAWGLLEDIAQALHDAPEIVDKIRVNYIAGPNKKWGLNAYEYIRREFPNLWIIEDNSTYRGWFNGGFQDGIYSNSGFVDAHKHCGALGNYFATHLGGVIKMGDTPTVTYFLNGTPENPEGESLGGSFIRVYHRPERSYNRDTTKDDIVEIFEVIEFVFDGPVLKEYDEDKVYFKMIVKNQEFEGFYTGNGKYKIRFMPKSLGLFEYEIVSDIEELNHHKGGFTAIPESYENRIDKGQNLKNWWADRLNDELREGVIDGAKTLNKYRKIFLDDFSERFKRTL